MPMFGWMNGSPARPVLARDRPPRLPTPLLAKQIPFTRPEYARAGVRRSACYGDDFVLKPS